MRRLHLIRRIAIRVWKVVKIKPPHVQESVYHPIDIASSAIASTKLKTDIPRGCVGVYVGRERQRFVVPTALLRHRLMRALLEKSAREFDFRYSNGIRIWCEVDAFREMVWLIQNNHPSAQTLNISDLHLTTTTSYS